MARNGGKPMNDKYSTTAKAEKLSNEKRLEKQWKNIDWKKAENEVNRLQIRIAKAVKENKWNKVKRLQYLIVHSYYAKILAVKTVATNKGRKTAGIDKVIWQTNSEKMNAAISLTGRKYKSKPLRRIYIDKKGKKTKRPLNIPCMYDRAMQALYAMELQPVAETTADSYSYGFRKYRSCQDACERIFAVLCHKTSAEWVLEGDIKGCFDHISHQWLIENIPMDKSILKQFLKAGFVYENRLFQTDEGTPQGGVISPILANMTLDGIQQMLAEEFSSNYINKCRNKVNFIRYADDFIVTASSKETAEKAKLLIKDFLASRGLELSEEKTVITNINNGFDMLGWTFRKFKNKLIIKPSRKSVRNLSQKLAEIILRKGKALTQKLLIIKLNQVLIGWGNYHRSVCSKQTFKKIDKIIFVLLWKWACHRHPHKSRTWVKLRYWHSIELQNWVFVSENMELKQLSYLPIKRHSKLNNSMNPFLNQDYFINRQRFIPIPI